MLRPTALDHVGLVVTDLDRALRSYQALGLELLRVTGPHPDGGRIAVVKVGGQEINVFHHPDVVPGGARDKEVGIDHLCLTMEAASMDDLVADLRGAGVSVVKGPVQRRDGWSVFVSDPDGIRVELRLPS